MWGSNRGDFQIDSYSPDIGAKASIRVSSTDTVGAIKRELFDEMISQRGHYRRENYESRNFAVYLCRSGERILLDDSATLWDCCTQRERTGRRAYLELALKSMSNTNVKI